MWLSSFKELSAHLHVLYLRTVVLENIDTYKNDILLKQPRIIMVIMGNVPVRQDH